MNIDILLLGGAGVVVLGVVAAKIGDRLGLPALLLFLGLGVLMGIPSGGHSFDNASLAHDLGFAALALILADGGLATKWRDIRPAIGPALVLSTVGVAVTIALLSGFLYVLGIPLAVAVLVAATMAPTDSAAVFSILRRAPIPPRVKAMLEGESGLNDAPTVLLVLAATSLALRETSYGDLPFTALLILGQLVGGLLLGAGFGWLGGKLLRNLALPSSGLYPLAQLGWAVFAYGLGTLIHVSAFAAVYVCSVVLSNSKLPHRHATRSFAEGIGWIAQIGLFVMLGLLSVPSRITLQVVIYATVGGLFLTFVARPLSVWVSLVLFKIPIREQVFVSWAGLRGAVPIILATVPLAAGLDVAPQVFDYVFVSVIVLTLLNAPSLLWVAKKLGLSSDAREVDIEVAPMDAVEADLLQVRVSDESRLHGVSVQELRLPANCQISLVIRGDRTFTPHGRDILKSGDEILVVTPSASRGVVEERLRAVDRSGRLAGWRVDD